MDRGSVVDLVRSRRRSSGAAPTSKRSSLGTPSGTTRAARSCTTGLSTTSCEHPAPGVTCKDVYPNVLGVKYGHTAAEYSNAGSRRHPEPTCSCRLTSHDASGSRRARSSHRRGPIRAGRDRFEWLPTGPFNERRQRALGRFHQASATPPGDPAGCYNVSPGRK